jgi:hypothetical protein
MEIFSEEWNFWGRNASVRDLRRFFISNISGTNGKAVPKHAILFRANSLMQDIRREGLHLWSNASNRTGRVIANQKSTNLSMIKPLRPTFHSVAFLHFCSWEIYHGSFDVKWKDNAGECRDICAEHLCRAFVRIVRRSELQWNVWVPEIERHEHCLHIWDTHNIKPFGALKVRFLVSDFPSNFDAISRDPGFLRFQDFLNRLRHSINMSTGGLMVWLLIENAHERSLHRWMGRKMESSLNESIGRDGILASRWKKVRQIRIYTFHVFGW